MAIRDSQWRIPDDKIADSFRYIKRVLEAQNGTIFVEWSRPVLEEVSPNVARSLLKKYSACKDGFKASKIAGLYTFWIAKLKPGFTIITDFRAINEFAGLQTGIAYIYERTGVEIHLEKEELLEIVNTLRYHTSSPHTLMHIFELWIERERMRHGGAAAQAGS